MKQPVSRKTYQRDHGYLALHLQEGAPLVDAAWNEAQDISWNLVRDLARAGGIEGTSGSALQIAFYPDEKTAATATTLRIKGGSGAFYAEGLPVLWPRDVLIDAQIACCAFNPATLVDDGGTEPWLQSLAPGDYCIYLDVWMAEVNNIVVEDLDDRALQSDRGTSRLGLTACVNMVAGPCPPIEINQVLLTVGGSYHEDLNSLYRLEQVGIAKEARYPAQLEVLWDDRAGAVATLVGASAKKGDHEVEVLTVDGFEVGNFVRFEACSVDDTVYQITAIDGLMLTVTPTKTTSATLSLFDYTGISWDGSTLVAAGKSQNVSVDSIVTDLPLVNNREIGYAKRLWKVLKSSVQINTSAGVSTYTYTLMLELIGLVADLSLEMTSLETNLSRPALAFSQYLDLVDRPEWLTGMKIKIGADVASETTPPSGSCATTFTASYGITTPPQDQERAVEVRAIAKIIRFSSNPVTMRVLLDRHLAFDHGSGESVTPLRHIVARRWVGWQNDVQVSMVDFEAIAEQDTTNAPFSQEHPLQLPCGLLAYFSVNVTDQDCSAYNNASTAPSIQKGDGWDIAVRADGWWDPHIFVEPVERPRARVQLATLTVDGDGSLTLNDERSDPSGARQSIASARTPTFTELGDPAAVAPVGAAETDTEARPGSPDESPEMLSAADLTDAESGSSAPRSAPLETEDASSCNVYRIDSELEGEDAEPTSVKATLLGSGNKLHGTPFNLVGLLDSGTQDSDVEPATIGVHESSDFATLPIAVEPRSVRENSESGDRLGVDQTSAAPDVSDIFEQLTIGGQAPALHNLADAQNSLNTSNETGAVVADPPDSSTHEEPDPTLDGGLVSSEPFASATDLADKPPQLQVETVDSAEPRNNNDQEFKNEERAAARLWDFPVDRLVEFNKLGRIQRASISRAWTNFREVLEAPLARGVGQNRLKDALMRFIDDLTMLVEQSNLGADRAAVDVTLDQILQDHVVTDSDVRRPTFEEVVVAIRSLPSAGGRHE